MIFLPFLHLQVKKVCAYCMALQKTENNLWMDLVVSSFKTFVIFYRRNRYLLYYLSGANQSYKHPNIFLRNIYVKQSQIGS